MELLPVLIALGALLLIINLRLLFAPKMTYRVITTPARRSGSGCLQTLLTLLVAGMAILVIGVL